MDQLILVIVAVPIVLYSALLFVFFIVLKKEIEKIRNDIRQINQKPALPPKKSKVDYVPIKKPDRPVSNIEKQSNEVIAAIPDAFLVSMLNYHVLLLSDFTSVQANVINLKNSLNVQENTIYITKCLNTTN